MNSLKEYINEKFQVSKDNIKSRAYRYHPKDKQELLFIIKSKLSDNRNADLNDIDTSEITDMEELFVGLDPYNINISDWDVSEVTNMQKMFYDCKNLVCDVSEWDVSNVTNMESMFENCLKFDSDMSYWDVSNVEFMASVFYKCEKFKGIGVDKWQPINVKDMFCAFSNCYSMRWRPDWYTKRTKTVLD